MVDPHDVQRDVADFARDVMSQRSERQGVEAVTSEVTEHFASVDGAGISLYDGKNPIKTLGSTAPFVEAADRFQHELGEGPCVEALREEERVHVADLENDDRWPRWAKPVVAELGVRSVLALQLFVRDRELGALNLYSKTPGAFSSDDIETASYFAAHAAVALSGLRSVDQLKDAMSRRTLIGQAEGILMERFGMDGERAFALLRRLSQHRNVKLYDLAEHLVRTRELPAEPS
ncbi:GAF and ANTAR domain-containing protein [Aeromicrobium halocynthiae]|uniref:GAF and ANTAR domain-containing protein n=1 Tax=Aeromicrobium halocynthiae TaxID=560557 RepID=A0ABN2W925_9ACTN